MGLLERLYSKSEYRETGPSGISDLGEVRIIDVREPDEFVGPLGHIPGAELVPLRTLQQEMKDWSKDQAMLMVCRSGGRSGSAAAILARAGFANVINLRGGMMAYNAASLPVEY
jgi:rhodanese-related sulfurtransferase